MKVNIADLTRSSFVYPRGGKNEKTVNTWISDIRARQRAGRDVIIIRLSFLACPPSFWRACPPSFWRGWTQEQIAQTIGTSQGMVAQIINNANFGEINNLLSQERDMDYIAGHYHMDIAPAWALYLEGKTDQQKFKALSWGLRTWDQWNFNECDERFGNDWPGRIPAQLIAHTLFYFTKPGDFVLCTLSSDA